jgi:serine/threonine-protein kinase
MEDTDFPPQVFEKAKQRVGSVLRQKWHIDQLVGMGGMAAVYAATHRTGSRVAIKILHPTHAWDEDVTRRFLREGYAANTVAHRGAVRILDDDVTEDGAAFLVMELLEGETFESRCERAGGKLPPADVLALMDQLLDTLAAAHAKRIVHRDIKPENVFVTAEGVVKLLDFGIAKLRTHPGSVATVVGVMIGTPRFMAPEQALGQSDSIEGRTDLWAVGSVMFWALAGRHVHLAETLPGQLVAHATKHAPRLGDVAPEVPAAVSAIVDRALAFDQGARWENATAMQQAIREAQGALGFPRSAPLLSIPPQDLAVRVPSGMDLERFSGASASSGLSRTDVAETLVQRPRASHRAPMALAIAAVVLAIAVYLVMRGGRDEAPPPAERADQAAQAEPIPTAPTVAPETPLPATAGPPGGAATTEPGVTIAPASADPQRKGPSAQPKASATRTPATPQSADGDWLNRQY